MTTMLLFTVWWLVLHASPPFTLAVQRAKELGDGKGRGIGMEIEIKTCSRLLLSPPPSLQRKVAEYERYYLNKAPDGDDYDDDDRGRRAKGDNPTTTDNCNCAIRILLSAIIEPRYNPPPPRRRPG